MHTPSIRFLLIGYLTLLLIAGCDSNEPDGGSGEEELITRMVLELTSGEDTITFTANDPDGDGSDLTFTPSVLALGAGRTYEGTITLSDATKTPPVVINDEIEEEADAHLFRYTIEGTAANLVSVTITDTEATYGGDRALPVGLTFQVATTSVPGATGTMRVELFHFDEGAKTGVGSVSTERDLDISFPIRVE